MSELQNKSNTSGKPQNPKQSKKLPIRGQSKKDEEKMKEQSIEEKVMQQ